MRSHTSRRIAVAVPAALALFSLAGCFSDASPPKGAVPQGGVDARSGRVVVDDVWVDSAHSVRAGADATLRLTLTNDGLHPDALVSVSTPAARRATLSVHGQRVDRINLPEKKSVDLERRAGSGVILHDVTGRLRPGDFFKVTMHFTRSPAVTTAVTVGPLGGSLSRP